ncbi:hypothetical protein HOD38_00665 [archaeon]|nr:hypothetical protein [archaeon]MBT4396757.1 hypothetical protein [archaeon]MBT4441367.1 hypothetical protein [archaeon]
MRTLLSLLAGGMAVFGMANADADELPDSDLEPLTEDVAYEPTSNWFFGSMFIRDGSNAEASAEEMHGFDSLLTMDADDGRKVVFSSTNPLDVNIEDGRYHQTAVGVRFPYLWNDTLAISAGTRARWDDSDSFNLGARADLLPRAPVTPRAGYLHDPEHGSGGFGGVRFDLPLDDGVLHGDIDAVGYDGRFDLRGFVSATMPLASEQGSVYAGLGGKLQDRVVMADVGFLGNDKPGFNLLVQYDVDDRALNGKLHMAFMDWDWQQGNVDFPEHVRMGTGNQVMDGGNGLAVLDGWAPFDSHAGRGLVMVANYHLNQVGTGADATLYLVAKGGPVEAFVGVRGGVERTEEEVSGSVGAEGQLFFNVSDDFGVELWGTADLYPTHEELVRAATAYGGLVWAL